MRRNFTLKLTFFLFLACFIIHSTFLIATVRYVSKTGSSTPPYTSWETAADSIQKCINICVFGDTIFVANGVYQEQVVMIPGLSLIGSGTDSCIVDGRSFAALGSRTIEMMDSCLVKGFYILATNNFDYGYGIYTEANAGLITENKFSNANTPIVLYGSNITVYKNYCFNFRRGIGVYHSNSLVRKNVLIMDVEGASGIRVERGSLVWTKNLGGLNAVAADAQIVAAADASDRITAWKTNTGEVAWTSEKLMNHGLSAPAMVGSTLVFGDAEGTVHFLSRDAGAAQLRLKTDGSAIVGSPVVAGTTVLVVTRAGGIYAMRPE